MTQGIRGRIYRHKKRGSLYRVLEIATMQCSVPDLDDNLAVVYEDMDGGVWVRPLAEFQDGRFEPVPLTRKAAMQAMCDVQELGQLFDAAPQADQSPKGQDREDGLDAQHASGGAEGMRQKGYDA